MERSRNSKRVFVNYMLIPKQQTVLEKIAQEGDVYDYPMPHDDLGIALQELNGLVPDIGWHLNKVCYEVCYIIEGKAKFEIENEVFNAGPGDVVVIEAGKKSRLQAVKLKMITITQPNWYEEQCENIIN